MNTRKAVVFSIDAILSVLITITLISASFFYLSQIHTLQWSQPNYFLTSIDTINVLRIDGTFKRALATSDGSEIKTFMDNMYGSNVCSSMDINNKDGTRFMQVNKTGCTSYNEVYIYRGTIVNERTIYEIVLKLWYE